MVLSVSVFWASLSFAAEGGSVRLDADVITFEESTGIATADGNVRMADNEFYATAPYLEFDNNSQQVTAFSSPAQKVVLITEGKRLEGDKLDYNLVTRRGKMINPDGKADVFHVKGKEIEVMPSQTSPDSTEEELAAVWSDASLTACDLPHPHYRLEARSVTIYPGRKMVLHRAKAYLGNVLLLASPFDITVPLDERQPQKFFPRFGYDETKGVGMGISGALDWNSGSLDMDFVGWTEGIFEMDAVARQYITRNFSVYAGIRRAYDKDMEETDWRSRWGLNYSINGWNTSVGWTRRELIAIEKSAGNVSRHTLERNPEVNIASPWFPDPAVGGRFRVYGVWGNYDDLRLSEARNIDRTGLGIEIAGTPGARENITPFYNASYTHFLYDDDFYDYQQIMNARVGVLVSAGQFDFKTAYLRQWVRGGSPMIWDRYGERDELYQEISMTIPTKRSDYYWNAGVRAAYDFKSDELAEMVYKLAYNHHCLLWEAVYRNDVKGNDDWFGLNLSITDFPSGSFRLFGSGNDLSNPFAH